MWGSPDEVYTAGIGQGEKYATMSAAQLRQELEKEQMERKKLKHDCRNWNKKAQVNKKKI